MKRKKLLALLTAVFLLLTLPSCMLAKDWFEDVEDDPLPSVAPPALRPTDKEFSEEIEVFSLLDHAGLYTPELGQTLAQLFTPPTPEPEENEAPEGEDASEEPEAAQGPIDWDGPEPTYDFDLHELAVAIGEDESGMYYVVKNQHGVIGYCAKEDFSVYEPERYYASVYTPKAGVNRPELVDVSRYLSDKAVVESALSLEENYLDAKPVMTPSWVAVDRRLAEKLAIAEAALARKGYTLKVVGGYYPQSVQYKLFKLVEDSKLVGDPQEKSLHPKGSTIDVTLLDAAGNELSFPTAVYEFKAAAKRPFAAGSAPNVRDLDAAMTEAGLLPGDFWWQFTDPDTDYMPFNESLDSKLLFAKERPDAPPAEE